jgi:hypothetical protein
MSVKKRDLSQNIERVHQFNKGHSLPRGSKTIVIPCSETEYELASVDAISFRAFVDVQYQEHPELFPLDISNGYQLHGHAAPSVKLGIALRRIKILSTQAAYLIRPCTLLPYMTGYTKDVENALLLQRYGVPYSILTHIFGRNDMYWYRMINGFGRNSIVGTTVKKNELLPLDLCADEKHTKLSGNKVYIATTVGNDCILGAALSLEATTEGLTEGYQVFSDEVTQQNPNYQPETVNTDGWKATGIAWLSLFPQVTLLLCFLHAYIKIRQRGKHLGALFYDLCDRIWNVYHAENARSFAQRIRHLKTWANKTLSAGTVRDKVISLCNNSFLFQKAYKYVNAHRTSNMIDRVIRYQDRYLFMMQYFHGHFSSAEKGIRAWAILRNFQPYCSRVSKKETMSAASKLNGFKYRENWLENLLVSSSMGGYRQ